MTDFVINDDYRIVPIDSITQDPENARVHDENDLREKRESLKLFGFTRPILVNKSTGIIAAGNGIHLAAKELGYEKVPVIFIEMSPIRAKSLSISDNKLGDHGKYNIDQFTWNIKEIDEWDTTVEWKALGFEKNEINLLLASINNDVSDDHGEAQLEDNHEELPEEERPAKSIRLNKRQRESFETALKYLKKLEDNDNISEGEFIEIISIRYLDENKKEI